jgi:hypothetical protein
MKRLYGFSFNGLNELNTPGKQTIIYSGRTHKKITHV